MPRSNKQLRTRTHFGRKFISRQKHKKHQLMKMSRSKILLFWGESRFFFYFLGQFCLDLSFYDLWSPGLSLSHTTLKHELKLNVEVDPILTDGIDFIAGFSVVLFCLCGFYRKHKIYIESSSCVCFIVKFVYFLLWCRWGCLMLLYM